MESTTSINPQNINNDKIKTHYLNCMKASIKFRETHREELRQKAKDYYDQNPAYKEKKKEKMREAYYKRKGLLKKE